MQHEQNIKGQRQEENSKWKEYMKDKFSMQKDRKWMQHERDMKGN